jgi:hypothetical protein
MGGIYVMRNRRNPYRILNGNLKESDLGRYGDSIQLDLTWIKCQGMK